MFNGLGGSIPFMAMLGERFPRAQFLITGTGGPGSNAHGPNEFLHVPFAERLTACVADLIATHYRAAPRLRAPPHAVDRIHASAPTSPCTWSSASGRRFAVTFWSRASRTRIFSRAFASNS